MAIIQLINLSNSLVKPLHIKICETFISRFLGLMFRQSIKSDEGILLASNSDTKSASSIHMFFMNFDIAVIWIDTNNRVVDKTIAKRWRPYYAPMSAARYILETNISRIDDYQIGDLLSF